MDDKIREIEQLIEAKFAAREKEASHREARLNDVYREVNTALAALRDAGRHETAAIICRRFRELGVDFSV